MSQPINTTGGLAAARGEGEGGGRVAAPWARGLVREEDALGLEGGECTKCHSTGHFKMANFMLRECFLNKKKSLKINLFQ